MKHAIIIPHRDRNWAVPLSLGSIERSACLCNIPAADWQVWLVDAGSEQAPRLDHAPKQLGMILCPRSKGLFNKPRTLNLGIDVALRFNPDVLTFLDVDAIVGPRFMENVDRLSDATLTRLCYRVRYATIVQAALVAGMEAEAYETFYASLEQGFEGYGWPHENCREGKPRPRGPIFGNSQFSIRRDTLGDLRFNESFVGRGFEDLWMIREIGRRAGDSYRAEIVTDAAHALIHVKHEYEPAWRDPNQAAINEKLYHRT